MIGIKRDQIQFANTRKVPKFTALPNYYYMDTNYGNDTKNFINLFNKQQKTNKCQIIIIIY